MFIALAISLSALAANATPSTLSNPIVLDDPGSCRLVRHEKRPAVTVTIVGDLPCDFLGDCFELTLAPEGHPRSSLRKVTLPFSSSYGRFRVILVDLTGDRVEEVLLVSGDGRGTSATRETLVAYQWRGAALHPILTTPISDYFGPGELWWYEFGFEINPRTGRPCVILDLKQDPPDPAFSDLTSPELIPSESHLEFSWNPKRGAMEQLPSRDSLLQVGGDLILRTDGMRVVVWALVAGSEYQGSALLPNRGVFVAYTDPNSGRAATFLAVVDSDSGRETSLAELSGTGESRFVYQPSTQVVLFNWFDGVYVFSLRAALENAASGKDQRPFRDLLVQVSKAHCIDPSWVTESVATCRDRQPDGSSSLVHFGVPLPGFLRPKSSRTGAAAASPGNH
jgi:hypothetical protein